MVKDLLRTIYFPISRAGFAAALFFIFCHPAFSAPSFTATLDRNTISLGETATLTLSISESATQEAPAFPVVPNLRISHIGQASQVQFVNGAVSSSMTHTFEVTPAAAGDFVIPSLRINIGGKTLVSQSLRLKVTQGQTPTEPEEKLPAFLKLIVPKTEIYVGEPIPVEIQLYCQQAQDLSMPQLQNEGFTVGTIPQPTQSRTRIGGEIYNLVVFKMAVAPTKAGPLTLGPATCGLKLLMGPQNIFGQFTQARQVTLKSEPHPLRVLPLPEANKPPGFNGAIGNFSMEFNAGPTNLGVGDPITMKVKISGRGALDLLSMPTQTEWREFKTYPPTSKVESADPLGLEGAKTFEQVVVPQNSEVKELPQFSFSFFDPARKAYRTLTNRAIPLIVHPTAATPQPTVFSNAAEATEKPPSRDIVHIKPQMGTVRAVSGPLLKQPWFLVLQAIAPLTWIASVIYRKRKENFENNPRLRRQREAGQIVARELAGLPQHAHAQEAERFFAGIFRLLQEQIGERLDLPASSITEAVVEEKLRPMRVDDETLALVQELFRTCNQARYARQRTTEELASFIPKVEKAIAGLRKIK